MLTDGVSFFFRHPFAQVCHTGIPTQVETKQNKTTHDKDGIFLYLCIEIPPFFSLFVALCFLCVAAALVQTIPEGIVLR